MSKKKKRKRKGKEKIRKKGKKRTSKGVQNVSHKKSLFPMSIQGYRIGRVARYKQNLKKLVRKNFREWRDSSERRMSARGSNRGTSSERSLDGCASFKYINSPSFNHLDTVNGCKVKER